eukprot:CAMPEP_0119267822 /NCGR_PEP_ID=MMETSP1329-20130426/5825_1 /TAXON_ID=114041 /ORGANISM="Genus nov. species nov., Strain RCC1024" /LENGTH=130 /DNA_ID=CAMNT_0007267763 /DNA_START=15 /DNA_END=404 /DNA_ORIENTATION=+
MSMMSLESPAASPGRSAATADGAGVDLGEIAQLIDQLKHEDARLRKASHERLPEIAAALGTERAREELVPFVCDLTDDADDVLYELAGKLGAMSDKVGGPRHAHCLLEPLEHLAAAEDGRVRARAVEAAT